jgi:hypothetical protein
MTPIDIKRTAIPSVERRMGLAASAGTPCILHA